MLARDGSIYFLAGIFEARVQASFTRQLLQEMESFSARCCQFFTELTSWLNRPLKTCRSLDLVSLIFFALMAIFTSFFSSRFALLESILLRAELLELLLLCESLDCEMRFLISQLDSKDLLRSLLEQKLFCELMRQCSCLFSFEISFSLFLRILNFVFRQFSFRMKRQSSLMLPTSAQVLFMEALGWETFLRLGRMGWVWLVGLAVR